MTATRITTSFIRYGGRFLIVKRSPRARTMPGLWSGISGIIEGDEDPIHRAKTEVFEEAGIAPKDIRLVNARVATVQSPQYPGKIWNVYSFLFESATGQIRLNWENSEHAWVSKEELGRYETVPSLYETLVDLL